MASTIKPKRSSVAGNVPTTSNIVQYEIAINTADKKIYTSDGTNIIQIGGGSVSSLSDVAINSPTNGQTLTYNSSTGKWENSTSSVSSISGEFTATASGSITANTPVVLNTNGTISQVGITGGAAISGTEVTLNSANSNFSNENGFVYNPITKIGMVLFADGASSFATRIKLYSVNTATNSTTVGTPKLSPFNNSNIYNYKFMHSPTYGSGIALHQETSGYPVYIRTFSMDSINNISYGTANTLLASTASLSFRSAGISTTTNKGLALYGIGTSWYVQGFDFTGGTFTIGSTATTVPITASLNYYQVIPLNNNRFLLYYGEYGGGTGIKYVAIAEVASDNSVTIGTPLSVGSNTLLDIAYNSTTNKAVGITSTSASAGSLLVFSCSTNNISLLNTISITGQDNFSSARLRWNSAAARFNWFGVSSVTGKVSVIVFTITDSNTMTINTALSTLTSTAISVNGQVGIPPIFDSNVFPIMTNDYATGRILSWSDSLVSTNVGSYIGIAKAAASNAGNITVQITGGVNTGQTGLTIGTSYFVADDGTLITTNNGRKIGVAYSTTGLLVNTNLTPSEMNDYLGSLIA